ncbi:hypothetical protein GOP47_0011576 [Adiantum capillus-veneris]|uniref:B-like cyclin n=1 Tax=Adiantum capillus-veneris TaxID=13818 RepID=A0A9D4UUF6_ADICA|nr:hypothetical protein GOP47_0011576 [Adiantum capillus-veneris]
MAPSVDCSAASLLCCEDSGCLSDEGEQEREECRLSFNYEGPSALFLGEPEEPHDAEVAISALVEREIFHLPRLDYEEKYQSKVFEAGSRQQAISWLFKVRGFYNFGPLTAALSVNYLDRFLSGNNLPIGKSWMLQLLSVACLSLAAKMEEVDVPLLLDLQVGPDCIFEPRTIQRMELLVLSTLEWRMSSVTPFSYIDYFVSKFDLNGSSRCILFSRVNELVLSTIQELKFVSYRPSSIAVAAVLCAVQELLPLELIKFKGILISMMPTQLHDSTERCFRLMLEIFLSPLQTLKDESSAHSAPRSPIGVLDASFSCDSESTYKSAGSDPSVQISSPAPKKRKLDDYCSAFGSKMIWRDDINDHKKCQILLVSYRLQLWHMVV